MKILARQIAVNTNTTQLDAGPNHDDDFFNEPKYPLLDPVVVATDQEPRETYLVIGIKIMCNGEYAYCLKKAIGNGITGYKIRWLSDSRWVEEDCLVPESEKASVIIETEAPF